MKFIVITKVADDNEGNLALAVPMYADWGLNGTTEPVEPSLALALRAPVFVKGEVLIVDEGGRELVGSQRKPNKWNVGYETFDSIDEAIVRAEEV